MMNLLGAVGPIGVGVYARNQPVSFLRQFDFVSLHAGRTDTEAKAAALKATGTRVWLHSLPGSWRPGEWPAALDRIQRLADRVGASGIIADPENGWGGNNAEAAQRLGAGLARAAANHRVVVTSFPLFPHLDALAEGCDRKVTGSPQLYAKGRPAAQLKAWAEGWRSRFGGYTPSVSAWGSDPSIGTPETYAAYLRAIPPGPGCLAWTTGTRPDWRFATYREAAPASSLALAAGHMTTPPVAVLLTMAAIIAIGVILWMS